MKCSNWTQRGKDVSTRQSCGKPAVACVSTSLMKPMELCAGCADKMKKEGAKVHYYSAISTNPKYIAYAKAHGRMPEEMMQHDAEAYPGGCMTGFILWISEMKKKFWKASPQSFCVDQHGIWDDKAWHEFILETANKMAEAEKA